ncbi:MAG TPA: mycofactocin biosynthesis glycosyltransferase MftF [Actinophytocola sp.]|uniref:mycofactocin biosynthesis glycosyltransferase MftF n=1 Tax=Actinophytocola sp. TaxID=1872138 RepID=UPI002F92EF1E
MSTPLPAGFRVELDPAAKRLTEDSWFGGSPARVLRLTAAGRAAWDELARGPVVSPAAAALARRLTDAGFAHPVPPRAEHAEPPDVTVVIPVRDRVGGLVRCLTALGERHPVVLVDDGSRDPHAVAEVAARFGAKLVVRPVSGGPGVARDSGLEHAGTELVAFVDSDCVPDPGWLGELAPHFADPLVAAVAPRIVPSGPETGWAARYTKANCPLDLGTARATVAPGTRVAYVPTAALLVRRRALAEVARRGAAFDPALRVAGEDVDLVWRLHEAGWRVRYEPAVHVRHEEPRTWAALLHRRYRYGTSAAPLALRHPGDVPPLVLFPWPTLAAVAAIARRPALALAAYAGSVASIGGTLRRAGLPTTGVLGAMAQAAYQTWLGIGRYGTQFAAPLLAVELVAGRRRVAAASLLFGPPLAEWAARREALDPVRYVLGRLADDIAYGSGVLAGCLANRTSAPVRPRLGRRPLRIEGKGSR